MYKNIYAIYKPHEAIPTTGFSWQDWSLQSPLFTGEGKTHAESNWKLLKLGSNSEFHCKIIFLSINYKRARWLCVVLQALSKPQQDSLLRVILQSV